MSKLRLKPRNILPEMTVRAAARLVGIPHATFHRFRRGMSVGLDKAAACASYMDECPCCGTARKTVEAKLQAAEEMASYLEVIMSVQETPQTPTLERARRALQNWKAVQDE